MTGRAQKPKAPRASERPDDRPVVRGLVIFDSLPSGRDCRAAAGRSAVRPGPAAGGSRRRMPRARPAPAGMAGPSSRTGSPPAHAARRPADFLDRGLLLFFFLDLVRPSPAPPGGSRRRSVAAAAGLSPAPGRPGEPPAGEGRRAWRARRRRLRGGGRRDRRRLDERGRRRRGRRAELDRRIAAGAGAGGGGAGGAATGTARLNLSGRSGRVPQGRWTLPPRTVTGSE